MSRQFTPSPGLSSGGSSPGSIHSQETVISTSPLERQSQSTSPSGQHTTCSTPQMTRLVGTSPSGCSIASSPNVPIPGSSLPNRDQASTSYGSHGHSGGLNALRGLFGGHKHDGRPIIVTAEGSISQHGWQGIGRESSVKSRLRTLKQLQEIMRQKNLQVSTLEGIYQETVDMLEDETTREPVLKAYIDLTETQFPQLGLALRQTFFEKIKTMEVSELSVRWLCALSKFGSVISGFEKYMDFITSDLLEETLRADGNHPQARTMINLTQQLIVNNAAFISKESMTKIVRCVCARACRLEDPLAEPCAKTLEYIMKYSELPGEELPSVIGALCQLIADSADCRETAWQVARALLLSTMGNRARKHLQIILENSVAITSEHKGRDHMLKILRGAIFCLSNANWGIQQIDSVRCAPASIIASLQKAMRVDTAVCKDVLMCLRRLLSKFGRDLQQITWLRIFDLFGDVIKLCDKSSTYCIECNQLFQNLLDICEELYEEGHLVNSADKLFHLIEKSSHRRAESSILHLIDFKLTRCVPQNPDWIIEMRKLVLGYMSTPQNSNIRGRVLSVLHTFYNKYRGVYEMDVVPKLMMPILHMTQREKDNKIQYQMMTILFDVAIKVTMRNDTFDKVLKLIHKLFNDNIIKEDYLIVNQDHVLRRDSMSTSRSSTSTRDTTPSDIVSTVCNDNLEIVAHSIGEILQERWETLHVTHITFIMDMMCDHLNKQYEVGLTGEEGGDVRVRVFASLLSFHGCPITKKLRRQALGEDDAVLNSFAFADEADVVGRPKYSGQFNWREICKSTTLALRIDTWWSTIRVILQCLYRVLESAFLVHTAGEKNELELTDAIFGLHKRAQEGSIQVADNELAKFLPPVLAVLLNYPLRADRQKEMCRILVECVKTGSMEAVMACDVAIQIVPESMAGFAHVLINNISWISPSAVRAVPTLELMNDAAAVPQFHTFFQEKQYHAVVDILMPYMNVMKFNTFIIASVHRILMRWFSTSPKSMRGDLTRYMGSKLQEAVLSSSQSAMSRQPSGDGRHFSGLSSVNGMPDTPPPMGIGGVQRTQEDVQEKIMDEIYRAMMNFFVLGSIPDTTLGMKEPNDDDYIEVDCSYFSIGDTILTLRTLVEKSKAWPPEEDEVFHDAHVDFVSPTHLADQRRRYQSAVQTSRKPGQPEIVSAPITRDDIAMTMKKDVENVPIVQWTQLIVRHMYGKNQWMMRSLEEIPDDFSVSPGVPLSHQPLLLHLATLESSLKLGAKNKNQMFTRIRNLDRVPGIELHAVGVLCIHPGQKEESEILANNFGSDRYAMFLSQLGGPISNEHEPAGLQNDQHGEFTFAHLDETSKIVFLVASLMPSQKKDKNCNMKKRLIGNNFIAIVWNESGRPFKLGQVCGSFVHVAIEVVPMDNDNLLIQVHAKQEIACWLAVRRAFVQHESAVPIIRKLIIRAKLAVDVWRSMNDNPQEPHISSAIDRLRKIQQLKNM